MELLQAIVAAAALLGVASALAPSGERIKKTVSVALSILFLSAVTAAAVGSDPSAWIPDLSPDLPESDLPTVSLEEGVEMGIAEDLRRSFSLSGEEVAVDAAVSVREGEVIIEKLTVTLCGGGLLADSMGIVRYVARAYGAECEVRFVGKKEVA